MDDVPTKAQADWLRIVDRATDKGLAAAPTRKLQATNAACVRRGWIAQADILCTITHAGRDALLLAAP
jgi:hypothetical protein